MYLVNCSTSAGVRPRDARSHHTLVHIQNHLLGSGFGHRAVSNKCRCRIAHHHFQRERPDYVCHSHHRVLRRFGFQSTDKKRTETNRMRFPLFIRPFYRFGRRVSCTTTTMTNLDDVGTLRRMVVCVSLRSFGNSKIKGKKTKELSGGRLPWAINSCETVRSAMQNGMNSNVIKAELSDEKPHFCAKCDKQIQDRYFLKALNLFWHEDCLKCGCCDCRLGDVGTTLFTRENFLLCKSDYMRWADPATKNRNQNSWIKLIPFFVSVV